MVEPLPHAGVKRPYSDIVEGRPHKKRHTLRHTQLKPRHTEAASQDLPSTQTQLDRSISAMLATAGYDAARPEALEMFRSHTEEYMQRFAHHVRSSMHAARRTKPTAPDFSMALSLTPNTSSASLLNPQLSLPIPESISCPAIAAPYPLEPEVDLSHLLAPPLTSPRRPSYVPAHFPALPAKHTYKATAVPFERESDARKMREKMTQEGMMAEQALRKLAAAAKAGAMKAERKRNVALSGLGRVRGAGGGDKNGNNGKGDAFADVLGEIGGGGVDGDVVMAGGVEDGVDVGMPEGVAVNYDMGHWRHRKALRL